MTYESWDHFRRLAAERRESFCRSLAALLEVLLPGDGLFPCASTLGIEGLVADRWIESIGPAEDKALTAALAAGGAPFATLPLDARVSVVVRLEREHPAVFDQLATDSKVGGDRICGLALFNSCEQGLPRNKDGGAQAIRFPLLFVIVVSESLALDMSQAR